MTEEEKKERIKYYGDWARSLWLGFLGLRNGDKIISCSAVQTRGLSPLSPARNREIIKFLILTGSLAGLGLTLDSRLKVVLLIAGIIADSFLVALIALLHRRIESLLATLGREEL